MNSPLPSGTGGPSPDSQWLVCCSPERTLVARLQGGETRLVKIFERGSAADAEREAFLARTLAQPGVVRYLDAGLDPVTRKPCVTMEFAEGENLEQHVAQHGPLPSYLAAELVLQVVRVLEDFHKTPRPNAPHGVVHRDIKPANVLYSQEPARADPEVVHKALLLDLEHAVAILHPDELRTAPTSPGFAGGTHGYSPPESYVGAYPQPAFDIFGLGATFFFVLTGCPAYSQVDPVTTANLVCTGSPRLHLLRGQPPILQQLIANCLAMNPRGRPTAADVAATLSEFLAARTPVDNILDQALQAIQAGKFDVGHQFLVDPEGEIAGARREELLALAARRLRLMMTCGAPEATTPAQVDDEALAAAADDIAHRLPNLTSFLRRFPHHPIAIEEKRRLAKAGYELLSRVPPKVAELKLAARFEDAKAVLEAATAAAGAIVRVPLLQDRRLDNPIPGPLLRNPGQLLKQSLEDVDRAETTHEKLMERLDAAERELDLAGAESVVEECTAVYGGASGVVATLKDRLHRLEFYLRRLAVPQSTLDRLHEMLELAGREHHLDRVDALSRLCEERTMSVSSTEASKIGIRGLLETMNRFVSDFPNVRGAVADGEAALRTAMEHMTRSAWDHVVDAEDKLNKVPIPIRPVQKILNRLDSIRLLESFVDLPDRSRELLQDEIEAVRMRLDQARTTRDNIARGARAAMDKGHLTTALFDMARAVDHFEDETGDRTEGQLAEQLEEAKRLKQDLETAAEQNQRLATQYVELLEQEHNPAARRIKLLRNRMAVLGTLVEILGLEKGKHYRADQREVTLNLVQELSEEGENQLATASDPETEHRIAVETLESLRDCVSNSPQEIGGRTAQTIGAWRDRVEEDPTTWEAPAPERTGRRPLSLARAVTALVRCFWR